MTLISRNPATDEILAEFPELTPAEIEEKLALAAATFEVWRQTSLAERAEKLRNLARILEERKDELARLSALEMGRPVSSAAGKKDKSAIACEYYADHLEAFLAPEKVETEMRESFVRFDPIGPVLAVMPWNFPFWQVIRFAAPALAAGNVGLLKHASNVPQCALALEQLFLDAGFPAGAFQTLLVGSRQVEGILRDDRVKGVALTGSENAGRKVGAIAGSEIKPVVLELGGSDPFIVLADADLDSAVKLATVARLQNNGQSCIAGKRFLVAAEIHDEFVAKFKTSFESQIIGDPLDPATTLGPVVSLQALEELHSQVTGSIAAGAELITGGHRIGEIGSFYAPTILANIRPGQPAWDEELFGPVASVIRFESVDEAIAIANGTKFGLGASVHTRDYELAKQLAARLDAGTVAVNKIVGSDPRLPFGGTKASGIGRELSRHGLLEFVNVKTVMID